jgi:hypothetical protein
MPPPRSDPAARYNAPVKKPSVATHPPPPPVTILKKKKKRQDPTDQPPPSTLKVRFEEDTRPPPPPPPIQQNVIKYPFASHSHPDAAIKKRMEPAYYDTSETVRCICENPTVDYGTFMISCDVCMVWFHGSCVGITEQMLVEEWICSRCR